MKTTELDYDLPLELVAQHPLPGRADSRLLVVDRASGTFRADMFSNLPSYLHATDCLVVNDTRVIRARLRGRKPSGGRVEIFLLHEERPGEWSALVRPSARVAAGTAVWVGEREPVAAVVGAVLPEGRRLVRFDRPDVVRLLEELGEIPLPPYIRRDAPDPEDAGRYQTVYAQVPGAVAAPTAGLHYTPELMRALRDKGVRIVTLTLHVGYGTFRPIQSDNVEDHVVEAEDFILSPAAAESLNEARRQGGRIVAVGTTATRVLETQFQDGAFHPGAGATDKYIYPGYAFRAIDALQTNFHLPRSSLLALVCAFAGRDLTLAAYRHAVEQRFRFYSYGDTMLIV